MRRSFTVFAAGALCGPLNIKAETPDEAARLYLENCGVENADVWVWNKSDYEKETALRPDPFEFRVKDIAPQAS